MTNSTSGQDNLEESSTKLYYSGFHYYFSFLMLSSYCVISIPLAFIYIRIIKCHLRKFDPMKLLVLSLMISALWLIPEIEMIILNDGDSISELRVYLEYNFVSYLFIFANFVSVMTLYYYCRLYYIDFFSKTKLCKSDATGTESDPMTKEIGLVGIAVMCSIVYSIFFLKDDGNDSNGYISNIFIPEIGYYAGRCAVLYFIVKVTEKYYDINKIPPPPDSTLEAINIFQDLDKPIAEQIITGSTQILLATIYNIRLVGPDFKYSQHNASFYLIGVMAVLAYYIKDNPFEQLDYSSFFWAQVFHAEKNASVLTRIRRLICFFFDVAVNVNLVLIIVILVPYQASVDDRNDGVSFVLNLVAIFYVIELDDLKEHKRFGWMKLKSINLPNLGRDTPMNDNECISTSVGEF